MTQPILDVRNLQVQFTTEASSGKGNAPTVINAVDGISFQVLPGQTLGIVGESGSGKSVTSLAVMGLVPSPPGKVTAGEIWFQEGDRQIDLLKIAPQQLRDLRGGRIAMIFQEPMSSLNPVHTIGFQLTEAIQLHQQVGEAEARRRAVSLLQEVRLLPSDHDLREQLLTDGVREIDRAMNRQKEALLNRYPHQMSGGQLQRVMIAMAISCNPALLIADEPTTALDVTIQAQVLELLRELRDRRGMGMIFITHDLGLIGEIADQVAVMYEGKIVEYGAVADLFEQPRHPYTQGLLTCRPRPDRSFKVLPTVSDFMEVVTTETGERRIEARQVNVDQVLQTLPEVTPAEKHDRLQALRSQPPLLSVQNLRVAYPIKGVLGRTQHYMMAVNDVSFDIYPGETLGLVGESGCGKTTLARTLLRLVNAQSGKILFDGQDILALKPNALRQLRKEMQIIFQNPFSSLDPRMSIGEAVMEPMKIFGGKNSREFRDRASYLLNRVGLSADAMTRYPHQFSGGQRQRICIARSLAMNPRFIICDESVSALDVSVQAQVLNLLKELQEEFGLTYVFISHDLSVVKFMSDRIMVMNRGRIEEMDVADRIYESPQQEYTKTLIQAIPVGTLEQIRERQQERQQKAG
ncbi:ABC transporter ATP-binding protein [Alkalinema sp. FACHB-956]|uniref:ABC transporter ATP-binding protein n=1 Tax=Alkalinema sp. FACHB-956 TaxID=2692768 RepID=UPI00168530C9|nr:ABC transporter ATP-binding protein [Alkalinema sp. FACHB-956]MBD2329047.1 ABC transporter ATP-binding protein [Alkalinema sp. FACHB-956]